MVYCTIPTTAYFTKKPIMKILILYKSVLGATKKYAEWLSEETGADIMRFSQFKTNMIDSYEIVVVSSGTYAGQMPLVSFLKRYWPTLSTRKVIVLAVGTIPPQDRESRLSYELIPIEIRERISYFKMPGRMLTTGPEGLPEREKLKPVVKLIKRFAKVK